MENGFAHPMTSLGLGTALNPDLGRRDGVKLRRSAL